MKKLIAVILAVVAVMSFMMLPVSAESEKTVSDIWVIRQPDKMTYYVGEKLDLTGIQIGVAYTDGTSEIVESGIEASEAPFERKGVQNVQISYMGETEWMTVNVDYSLWQKITSIITYLASFFYISAKNIIAWF